MITCPLQHDQTLPLSPKDVACDPNYCCGRALKARHAISFSRGAVNELHQSCANSLHECDEKVKCYSRQFSNGPGSEASDLRTDNVAICPVGGATMATQGQALHQNHELNPSDLFMH